MIRNCMFAYNHGRYKNGDLIYSYFLKKEAFFVKKNTINFTCNYTSIVFKTS